MGKRKFANLYDGRAMLSNFQSPLVILLALASLLIYLPAGSLLHVAVFHEQHNRGGRLLVKRNRRTLQDMHVEYGPYRFRRAYRMTGENFDQLVTILTPYINVGKGYRKGPNGKIPVAMRVSATIRYLAGGSPDDIGLSHGVSPGYLFDGCIWPVIDAINKCPSLKVLFPTDHAEQRDIARGFQQRSDADFDSCVSAIDGILIWTEKPQEKECQAFGNLQSGSFFCGRKHKFGFNMQALCDFEGRFMEFWITTPAATSDFLSFITSDFYNKVKVPGFLVPGLVIFGDNAYVSSEFMASPYKNVHSGANDAYNFYQSQLRIRIEMAFGMLTRRWGILRSPLSARLGMAKQIAIASACVRLHNFCLGPRGSTQTSAILPSLARDEFAMESEGTTVYSRDSLNRPVNLLGGGEHLDDIAIGDQIVRRDEARRRLRRIVDEKGLQRPPPASRR
jgi:hypothetical protein